MLAHKLRRVAGADAGTLTQKGYGHVYGTSATANVSMSYANVDGGSAPAAGDLIVWVILAADNAAQAIDDLTASGWVQQRSYSNPGCFSILAKVAVAGDISSPAQIVTAPTGFGIGFWVTYSVSGTVSTLTIPTFNSEWAAAAAPTNQTVDSSAMNSPDVGITVAGGGGDDDSPSTAMSGATADITFDTPANQWLSTSVAETRFLVNAAVGGANITISKADDGVANHLVSGYVSVVF